LSKYLKVLDVKRELQRVNRDILRLEEELSELEEALQLVKSGRARSAYRIFGSFIALEVSIAEASQIIEDRIAVVRAALATLRKRRDELAKELASLSR